jgi:hypothetical protein
MEIPNFAKWRKIAENCSTLPEFIIDKIGR